MLLCLALLLSVFVACDNSGNSDTDTSAETTVGTSAQTSAETSADTTAETSAETSAQTSEETSEATSTETTSDTNNSGIAENEWDAMTAASKFDNVTFTNNATFVSGYDSQSSHINVFKMDGDKGTADGEQMNASSMEAARSMITGTAVAIVKDFDKFTYNAVTGYYSSTEDIVYNVSIMGINATITAKNVVVKLDADMNIASISCNMTHNFNDGGVGKTYVLNAIFTFTDYGTTVVG